MNGNRASTRIAATAVLLGAFLAGRADAIPAPEYLGPTEYTSLADTPFDAGVFGFCVENFEDSAFSVPGSAGNGTFVGPGGLADSVDGDDGMLDGSGSSGRSYFSGGGSTGITFTFDPARTYGLPTEVGVVWTDGAGTISFEAFGPDGQSLLGVNGPNTHADGGFSGTTAEDRFYGAVYLGGISKVTITNTAGGIEVDHLQLNRCVLCGDANLDLRLTAPDALLALKASVGTETCRTCLCDTNDSSGNTATDALAILRKSVGLTPVMNCPTCAEFDPT